MKLVSKKNGTTSIFPNLISAVASKIGFTPPNGMTATNVQDAIAEVNGKILRIETDTIGCTNASTATTINITFSSPFSDVPAVIAVYETLSANSQYIQQASAIVLSPSTTGFSVKVKTDQTTTMTGLIRWVAIGNY